MKNNIKNLIYLFTITAILFTPFPLLPQDEVTRNLTNEIDKIVFVYGDIYNFNNAFQMFSSEKDTSEILKINYFDKASPGLKAFIRKYNLTNAGLLNAIKKYPTIYDSVKFIPELISSEEIEYKSAFIKLKEYIPDLVFPPIYFLIGEYSGIGSASEEGLLIEVQHWRKQQVQKHTSLIIHELVHFQQVMAIGLEKYRAIYKDEKSLLALIIREGTAEFFADFITGRYTQEQARNYVTKNERELWEKFQKEMSLLETGEWMWKKPLDPEQPRDIGYIFGAKIVESYFGNAQDKNKAVQEILSVTDYTAFLNTSRYEEKFK